MMVGESQCPALATSLVVVKIMIANNLMIVPGEGDEFGDGKCLAIYII